MLSASACRKQVSVGTESDSSATSDSSTASDGATPVCPVPTELKKSDPAVGKYDGVDILLVIDNSGSMSEEQQMLSTSLFPLINSLTNPLPGWPYDANSNIRIAVTTSDLGVSYDGKIYAGADNETLFANERVRCFDDGDGAEFVSQYRIGNDIQIRDGGIPCGTRDGDNQCPSGWTCENVDAHGVGTCTAPGGELTVLCPRSPGESDISFIESTVDDKATVIACLAQTGTTGCNYEQQLMAGVQGLEKTLTQDGSSFMRKSAVTAIIIVSDEEDCSLKSNEWHQLEELSNTTANVACGRHPDLLFKISEIKDRIDAVRKEATGTSQGVVFAAIVGVPYNENGALTECEGVGSGLGGCADIQPNVNGGGTMADPDEVERAVSATQTQTYYEYACTRTEMGVDVTKAYPGMRYVDLARKYGDNGYIYSICHNDWTPAMEDIATLIAKELDGTCYAKRLAWDPKTETADCDLVFDYEYRVDEYATAPKCPTDQGQVWESDEGELSKTSRQSSDGTSHAYWVRSCAVKKRPAPIHCQSLSSEAQFAYSDIDSFGWYYCENPGEDNRVACSDNIDNDRDGLIDEADDSCMYCSGNDMTQCKSDCPYNVSLTPGALRAMNDASDANIVCLQTYRFEDPNCTETTFASCNDGEDNDGNGAFDCWSYSKHEYENGQILAAHHPEKGARNADPNCCPMAVDEKGNCQFLDESHNEVTPDKAAWLTSCGGDASPAAFPDSCCEAAVQLSCRLPEDSNATCNAALSN